MVEEGFRYYATKPLKIGDGWRQPGEEVPEAAEWRNLDSYIHREMIVRVPIKDPRVFPTTP